MKPFGDGRPDGGFSHPPADATCWTSRGNYGSTILDQSPGEPSLEIIICDPCLYERRARAVEFAYEEKQALIFLRPWHCDHPPHQDSNGEEFPVE